MKCNNRQKHPLIVFVCSFVILGLLTTANLAGAVPLSDLLGGSSITVDDKRFFNWQLELEEGTVDTSLIDVQPLSDPLNPGLSYEIEPGALTVSGPFLTTPPTNLYFQYDVAVTDPLFRITDNSLELVDWSIEDDASIGITELVWDNADELGQPLLKNVNVSPLGQNLFADLDFNGVSFLHIEKQITLSSDPLLGGTASLFQFEQRFSQSVIPEPTTITLLGFGLIGLAGFRRKLK